MSFCSRVNDNSLIRFARSCEAHILTDISLSSKRIWNYPPEYFEIWRQELTITPSYIEDNLVVVFECEGNIHGYFSLVELEKDLQTSVLLLKKGIWLDHMFVKPGSIGQGVGTTLMGYLRCLGKEKGIRQVLILADPNAKDFYLKMGAEYNRECPSSIPDRTTPLLTYSISS